jgi:putative methyltransferase (TIGR04325 family)
MGHHMRWFRTLTKSFGVKELLASPGQQETSTYDSGLIAKVVVEKNVKLTEKLESHSTPKLDFVLLRPLLVFALIQKKKINVFDLGGGGGTHYHITRKLINNENKLKWAVLETPSMVAKARSISNEELSFFSEYSHALEFLGNIDVALASSVFQYLRDPIEELIKFINLGAEFIFITRTALTDQNSTLRVIQKTRLKDNGPGSLPKNFQDSEVQYPLTVVNKNLFMDTLSEKYSIVSEIEEDRAVHEINGHLVNQYGFLCIKK